MAKTQLLALLGSLAFLAIVVGVARRKRLGIRHIAMWTLISLTLLALSLWPGLLDRVARLAGVSHSTNALLALGFGFVILFLIYFSTVVTRLSRRNQILAQEMAALESRLEEIEGENEVR